MITVIIPTWNAGKQIGGLLAVLKSQTVRCEMLVVDSSSPDGTAGIARSLGAEVVIIRKEEFDHGGTRTMAAEKAKGIILVFMTQDALPFNAYAVENLLRSFEDQTVGAAYGRQLPYPGATPFSAHLRRFNYPEGSHSRGLADCGRFGIKTPFLSNSFAAYRKSALKEIGNFKESLILGEDTFAGARLLLAGYKIAYVADAMVYHSHNYAAFEEFKRYFDIGVFHRNEQWILKEFGRAEGEGKRYIRSELSFIMKQGKYHLLPESLLRNFLKYAGYRLGKRYERMPRSMARKISMHRDWWKM